MSQTPRTDQAERALSYRDMRMMELELAAAIRERDEAKGALDAYRCNSVDSFFKTIKRVETDCETALVRSAELEKERDEFRDKLESLPADWTQDSSLETWFPLTAESLLEEKARRIYYQQIVYDVCNRLDKAGGNSTTAGTGIVCGTIEAPSRETQDAVDRLIARNQTLSCIAGAAEEHLDAIERALCWQDFNGTDFPIAQAVRSLMLKGAAPKLIAQLAEWKECAAQLRLFAIHYADHPKRNPADSLPSALAEYDRLASK